MKEVVFYSSVGGTAFIEGLLENWRRCGVIVNRCHALTEHQYRTGTSLWSTLVRRWRMYGGYACQCWHSARAERHALKVVTTNPFFAPALVRWGSSNHCATIHLLYDLYPEALVAAGVLAPNSWGARWCAKLMRYTLRECAATVFLGRRLQAYAETTYGHAKRSRIIPVGADGHPFRDREPTDIRSGMAPIVLYCGQMGRMHDVDTLAVVLPQAVARRFSWCFHASGAGCAKLKRKAQCLEDVVFGHFLDGDAWRQAMLGADIALVTIARGGEKVVMPSKAYSALVAGQAILAICVRESDLADLVLEHDCGWVVEPGDTAGLAALLEWLSANPGEILAKRRNAYRAGHEHYDMAPIAKQWLALFQDLESALPVKYHQ